MNGGLGTWLIDARTFSSKPTGIGMYAYRLIKRMIAEQVEGRGERRKFVLVADVSESHELQELKRLGCEVRTYEKRVFNSMGVIGYFRWMKRVVREVQPDVFWQPNNVQPFRVKGVRRVIVTMHDVFGLGWNWRYALWHLYYRWNFRRTLKNVTEIWYNSEQTRREVMEKTGGESRWREVVTHPIAEVPERMGVEAYEHERPYFLYLGNVETRKGADILFAAYRNSEYSTPLHGQRNMPDLIIAGNVRNVAVPSDAGIVHLGYVDEATKFSLMKGCVAMVVPSRAEGYGMQLAEALAFGTRVIASDLPVFREVEEEVVGAGGMKADGDSRPTADVLIYLRGFRDGSDEERVKRLKDAFSQSCNVSHVA